MRGDFKAAQGFKVGMGREIETILKELFNGSAAELSWRQADVVNNQKIDGTSGRTHIEIRRWPVLCGIQPALVQQPMIHVHPGRQWKSPRLISRTNDSKC